MAKIAAQGFTLRETMKTPTEIAQACKRVKEMGYDGIQLSAHGPIDPKEMRQILDDNGLECPVTHRSLDVMEKDPQAIIDEHHILGTKYTAIGGFFPGQEIWRRQTWEDFVVKFNHCVKSLAAGGIELGYHNHHHEFCLADDIRPINFLMGRLEAPAWFELDTFWVAKGGADPAEYIRRLAGRLPCIHFKDYQPQRDGSVKMCEIGDGTLNWPAIVEATRYAGCKWLIVERDNGDMDPYDSLKRSLYNMKEKLAL